MAEKGLLLSPSTVSKPTAAAPVLLLSIGLLIVSSVVAVHGQTMQGPGSGDNTLPPNFLRFGVDAGDSVVPLLDDGSSSEITLNRTLVFYGRRETSLYVGTNGVLSFGSPYTSLGPQRFPVFSPPLIAPFFHDIDISTSRGGRIYYRQTSNEEDIATVTTFLQTIPSTPLFNPTLLFVATWDTVPQFFGGGTVDAPSERNTFQVILATDNQTTLASFAYGDIQWGERADIGFNAGNGIDFFTVPSSGTANTTNIDIQSNVGVPGLFIYRVDGLRLTPENFLTFGSFFGDSVVPTVDDGSSPEITLSTSFTFYGRNETSIYVNTNGVLSFGSPYTMAGPQSFPISSPPLIAPFFHDIDTEGNTGTIYYRQTSDETDISRVTTALNTLIPNTPTFTPTMLFIGTWDAVGQFSRTPSETNTFQVVLATNNQTGSTIASFAYGDIQWGEQAEIGFNAGDGIESLTVPSSGTANTTNIETQSNVGVPGLFIYRVDEFTVATSAPPPGHFLPFGGDVGDTMVPVSDDGSSSEITLNTDFVFYGRRESSIYVGTNGVLSFGTAYTAFGPQRFPSVGLDTVPLIAPFFHDVDISQGGSIYYRQTSDEADIMTYTANIHSNPTFTPTLLFVATWDTVAAFHRVSPPTNRNTFQVVLATDNETAIASFAYGDIQWGERAEIGFNAGNREDFFTVPSSGTTDTVNIETQSNVGISGLFVFRVDDVPTACFEGDLRIRNLNSSSAFDNAISNQTIELTFEVCSNEVYSSVCNIGWDDSDAAVVCRYQGYSPPIYVAEATTVSFTSNGTVTVQDVMCNGTESSISNCLHSTSISPECSQPNLVAAARCIERLELTGWVLDMNLGYMVLRTSATSGLAPMLNCSKLFITNSVSSPTANVQLTGCDSVETAGQNGVSFVLLLEDLNLLKTITDLATFIDDTFLVIEPENGVTETGTGLELRSYGNGVQVTEYIADFTRPTILGFSLNLATSMLSLTFDEPVLVSTVNFSQVLLHTSPSTNGSQLTGGELLQPFNSPVIEYLLSSSDILSLLQSFDPPATITEADVYLTALPIVASDTNFNPSIGISDPLQVSEFTAARLPHLIQFSLDMDEGEMVLTFNNYIIASSVNVGAITLQSFFDRLDNEYVTFTRMSSMSSDEDGLQLTVSIGDDDLLRLTRIPTLATNILNTFLALAPNFATDIYGNSVQPILESAPIPVALFIEDMTGPNVESWTLDMNLGQITLTFDELINTSSLDPVQISLYSTKTGTTGTSMFSLTGGSSIGSTDALSLVLGLSLTVFDTNVIKAMSDLGTERANTFLASAAGMVADLNGNPSSPILDNCTLQVNTYTRDATGPVFQSFDLDLNTGIMILTFNEPVEVSSLNPTELLLVNHPFSPTAMYELIGGFTLSGNDPIVVLALTIRDLNNIKAIHNLATDVNTSFVVMNPGFIQDTSGNRPRSVLGLQTSTFVHDTTPPVLVEFSLDVCSEQLSLTFCETVSVFSIDPTGITLIQSTIGSTMRMYTLTGGEVLLPEDSPVVTLQLNRDDAAVLLQDNTTLVNTSLLALQSNTIMDFAGNLVIPIPTFSPILFSSLNTSCVGRPRFVGGTRVDGSCVAVPLNTTWHEPIVAESGALDVSITAINVTSSSMSEVQTSVLSPTKNPRRWYINVTWTPDIRDDVESNLTLCYTATDSLGFVSRESCITLIAGVEAPQVDVSSLTPRGDILFNQTTWSLRFNKEFRRPTQGRFIRIFAANGTELIAINTSRSVVTYPQGRLGRELTFQTSYLFTEKERYYIHLDAGVAQGRDLCGLDSPVLSDPTIWTVRIADITPPTLRFVNNPMYSNANVIITWSFDENTTSQCTLVTPSVPFRVPCLNNTFKRTGLTNGVYSLFIVGTDLAGNTAQTVIHSWTVDVTPPRVTITTAPPSITNLLQASFSFRCIDEWRCTYMCSVHLLNTNPQYSVCSGSYTADSLASDGQYEFSVIATDGVGNVGAPVIHRWKIDITPPTIPSLADITLPCGQDYSPAATGTPTVETGVRLDFSDTTSAMCTVVRTWTATDQAGNTATQMQTITFSSPLPPLVTALPDINIPCGSVEDAIRNVATEELEVSHPCDRPVVVTFTDSAVVTMCGFTLTRMWMVNDDCDGSVTFNQNIRVLQQQFPESPIDGQMNAALNEPLGWPQYPGATSYRVFVWEFGTNRPDHPVATLFNTRRYNPSTNYNPGTRYLWQIEYITGVNSSVPSPIWGFETRFFPDLSVTNVMIPEYVFSGQSFDVSWTVINQGNISTPSSMWTDVVYTGTTPNFASSIRRAIISQNRFADPQDGYMSSTTIDLDITFTGNLYVFVRTDAFNNVLDFDRSNNILGAISPLEVRLTPPPNLVVESISTPRSPLSGERIRISWSVRNIGLGATATSQWTDRVYLSTDNQLDTRVDVHLGDYGHMGILAEGSFYENSANVTLPQRIYGNYFIVVTTDVSGNVFEHVSEDDNTNSSSPMLVILSPPPDLMVSSIEAQATYSTGNVMTVNYTVTNLGPGEPFERSWQDVVALVPQFPGAPRRIIGRINYQGNLVVNGNYTRTISYTVGSNFRTGRYQLTVETDSGNNVFEFNNDGNNIASREVTILQALPDLLISDASATVESTSEGNTILLNYTVTNMGTSQTLGAPWRDSISISSITNGQGYTYPNAPTRTTELGVNEEYTRTLSLPVPRNIYGNINLILHTDSNGRVTETLETNNRFTVGPLGLSPVFPDLAITLEMQPAAQIAVAGSILTITWTVTNIGNGLIDDSYFTDQVYLDITPQLSLVARRLSAPRLRQTIPPNFNYTQSASILLPATFSGPYFIIVRTDDRGEVDEDGSEVNNIASMPLNIRPLPSPDLIVTSVTYNYVQTESKDRILTVNWRVNNTGNSMEGAQSWTDQVFVSGELTFTRNDATRIWQREITNLGLDYQGTYTASASILIPTRIFGDFYVYIETDGTNEVTEINGEDNNIHRAANRFYIDEPPAARLIINLNMSAIPSSLSGGENITIVYDVTNTGDAALVATSWIDRVYLITDRNFRRDQVLDEGIILAQALNSRAQGLPDGEGYSISLDAQAPYGIIRQLFHIAIIVDINTDLGDPDQLLTHYVNPNFILIEQGPLPDLVLIPTTVNMTSLFGGQPTTVSYRIENRGNNTARGIWYETLYLSQDIVLDPFDTQLRTVSRQTDLPVGGSYSQSVEVFIPFDMPSGAYYFFYRVDAGDRIEESDENNNIDYQLISIVETVSTDITAVSVSAFPTSLNYGDNVTFQWVLRNNGSQEARGYKCDSIYFSDDDTWDIMDYQIGLPQCGPVTLPPSDGNTDNDRSYRQREPTPFIAQQSYTGIMRTRTNIRDPNLENNIITTTTPLQIQAPELVLDTLTTIEISSGEELVYRIENVPPEETLIATLTSSGGDAAFHDLFLRYDNPPTGYTHDAFSQVPLSSDQRAVVRNTRPGTYYLRIESSGFNTERYLVRVLVRVARFEILDITPSTAAPLGNVTLFFSGTVFGYNLEASLVNSANSDMVAIASRVYWFNSEQVYATFDISNFPTGMYTVQLTNTLTREVSQLADRFEIAPGIPGQVAARLLLPGTLSIRGESTGTITVLVANRGNTDILIPLMKLSTGGRSNIQLVDGAFTSSFSSEINFLANPTSGPAGILPPGTTSQVRFNLALAGSENRGVRDPVQLSYVQNPEDQHDYVNMKDDLRPSTIEPRAWDVIWQNFMSSVGTTWGSLNQKISEIATELSLFQRNIRTTESIVDYLLQTSDGLLTGDLVVDIEDLEEEGLTTVVPLKVIREYSSRIKNRRTVGPMGMGWQLPWWEMRVRNVTSSEVQLQNERADMITFSAVSNGLYRSEQGYGITVDNGGVRYLDTVHQLLFTFQRESGKLMGISFAGDNTSMMVEYRGQEWPSLFTHSNGKKLNVTYTDSGRISYIDILDQDDNIEQSSLYTYDDTETYLTGITIGNSSTTYSYNEQGDLIGIDYATGKRKTLQYDDKHMLCGLKYYNNAGEFTSGTSFMQDGNGNVELTLLPRNTTQMLLFDMEGVPIAVREDGGLPSFSIGSPSGEGQRTILGDKVLVENFMSSDGETETTIQTDANGHQLTYYYGEYGLERFTDNDGNEYNTLFDNQGRITEYQNPDGSRTRLNYDDVGHVTGLVNPDGSEVAYSYDLNDQVIQKTFPGDQTSFEYDDRRRLRRATNTQGSVMIFYNDNDSPHQIVYSNGRSLTYGYNDENQRSFIADNNGYNVTYTYNGADQLSEIRQANSGELVTRFEYNSRGLLSRKTLGNRAYTTYEYEEVSGLLMELRNYLPSGTLSSSFLYEYDRERKVAGISTHIGNNTYGYDAVGQLVKWTDENGDVTEYRYDSRGNRLVVRRNGREEGYSVNNMNQYMGFNGTQTFLYDMNGNVVEKSTSERRERFVFDAEGRLTQTETPDIRCSYLYDPLGNLYRKNCLNSSFEYLVDPFGRYGADIIAEIFGNETTYFVHSFEEGLAAALNLNNMSMTFYEQNGEGSIVGVLDGEGNVLNTYKYDPFGKIIEQSEETRNIFKYAGRFGVICDEELQQIYMMRARHYDAKHGRFLSPDPLGLSGSAPNFYAYVRNNPLSGKDPSGKIAFLLPYLGWGALSTGTYIATQIKTAQPITLGGVVGSFVSGAILGPFGGGGAALSFVKILKLIPVTFFGNTLGNIAEKAVDTGREFFSSPRPLIDAIGSAAKSTLTDAISKYFGRFIGHLKGFVPKKASRVYNTQSEDTKSCLKTFSKFFAEKGIGFSIDKLIEIGSDYGPSLVEGAVEWIGSFDPNDILGPAGYGAARFVPPELTFEYTIRFENEENATAPAQRVFVVHRLDDDLDIRTFRLGSFGFTDFVRNVTFNRAVLQDIVNLTETQGVFVRVRAGLDVVNNQATWEMQALDPETGEPPADPSVGFLPPNNDTDGQGFVTFSVRARRDVQSLSRIDATATIFFDLNEPIETPPIFNTIDGSAPSTGITVNQDLIENGTLALQLNKTDIGSGVEGVDIYQLVTDGNSLPTAVPIIIGAQEDTVVLPLTSGAEYTIFASTVDNVGNRRAILEDMQNIMRIDFPIVEVPCPNDCSDRGNCTQYGTCQCEEGYYGADCSQAGTQVQPPILVLSSLGGFEDTPVGLQLSAISTETGSSDDLLVHLTSYPQGASFSRGSLSSDVWTFTPAEFGEVEMTLPEHYSGIAELQAHVTSSNDTAAVLRDGSLQVNVEGIADTPFFQSDVDIAGLCNNLENISIPIFISLVDTDGSEMLGDILVKGLPDYASVVGGQLGPNGEYTLSPQNLSTIVIRLSGTEDLSFVISITAQAIELGNGHSTTTNVSVPVDCIRPVNECEDGTHKCEQLCTDTEEAYICSCNDEYVLDENGFNCTEKVVTVATETPTGVPRSTIIIIASVVGAVALIILVLFIIMVCCVCLYCGRRRHRKDDISHKATGTLSFEINPVTDSYQLETYDGQVEDGRRDTVQVGESEMQKVSPDDNMDSQTAECEVKQAIGNEVAESEEKQDDKHEVKQGDDSEWQADETDDGKEKLADDSSNRSSEAEKQADKTGESEEKQADKTGESEEKQADKTGESEEKQADKAGESEEKQADKTGESEEKQADKTGESEEKQADKAGESEEKLGDDSDDRERKESQNSDSKSEPLVVPRTMI